MNTWLGFYQNKLNKNYLSNLEDKYTFFISLLKTEMEGKQTIAEFGCGISNITKLIMNNNSEFSVIDNNTNMLKLSRSNLNKNINYILLDITKRYNKNFDLIHSHGVLEHLSINNIKKSIGNQLKISNNLFHYVPSNKYNYKSFGDELLLSKEQWKGLVNPDEIIEFNNGYDLILKWRE